MVMTTVSGAGPKKYQNCRFSPLPQNLGDGSIKCPSDLSSSVGANTKSCLTAAGVGLAARLSVEWRDGITHNSQTDSLCPLSHNLINNEFLVSGLLYYVECIDWPTLYVLATNRQTH